MYQGRSAFLSLYMKSVKSFSKFASKKSEPRTFPPMDEKKSFAESACPAPFCGVISKNEPEISLIKEFTFERSSCNPLIGEEISRTKVPSDGLLKNDLCSKDWDWVIGVVIGTPVVVGFGLSKG